MKGIWRHFVITGPGDGYVGIHHTVPSTLCMLEISIY